MIKSQFELLLTELNSDMLLSVGTSLLSLFLEQFGKSALLETLSEERCVSLLEFLKRPNRHSLYVHKLLFCPVVGSKKFVTR